MDTFHTCNGCGGSGWFEMPFEDSDRFSCDWCNGTGRTKTPTASQVVPLNIAPAYGSDAWFEWSESFDCAFEESRALEREMLNADW